MTRSRDLRVPLALSPRPSPSLITSLRGGYALDLHRAHIARNPRYTSRGASPRCAARRAEGATIGTRDFGVDHPADRNEAAR
jgi:hypothetical protein